MTLAGDSQNGNLAGCGPGGASGIEIQSANRDALARIAERDYGGASLDETVARLAFEHESFAALARLSDEQLHD